jgi:hypothetical protein
MVHGTAVPNSSSNKQNIEKESISQRITAKPPSSTGVAKNVNYTCEFQEQQVSIALDSNESSPTSQNAEECVSGFISGFEGFLGDKTYNQERGPTVSRNSDSEILKRTKDKDIDGKNLSKQQTIEKENMYSKEVINNRNATSTIIDKNTCQGNDLNEQGNKKDIRKATQSAGCVSSTEESVRQQGQKRPAGQDIKENKVSYITRNINLTVLSEIALNFFIFITPTKD